MDVGASLSGDMFSMMRNMNGFAIEDLAGTRQQYNIANQKLNVSAYAEVGLGYSRQVTDKLTVGGRVKVLFGIGQSRDEYQAVRCRSGYSEPSGRS